MRNFLLLATLFFILDSTGYAQNFKWAKNINMPNGGTIQGIDVDASGNSYVTGYFYRTAAFGNTTLTCYNTDIFVAKYDSAGSLQWAKQASGTEYIFVKSISVDRSDNSYVIGAFSGKANFDGISVEALETVNIFIAKYSPQGVIEWVKKINSTDNKATRVNSIDTDPLGNIYLTGLLNGTAAFDAISVTGSVDMFLAKYNSNGAVQWVKKANGSGWSSGDAISVDANGNSYVTGTFSDTTTFENTRVTSAGSDDIFIAKYSSAGKLMWVQSAGGVGWEQSKDIGIDQSGNCVVMGRFVGTASFSNIKLTSVAKDAIFIAKYSANGQVQWAQQLGVNQGDPYGYGLCVDQLGNSYLTGYFSYGGGKFSDIVLQNIGKFDAFIAKCSPNGVFQWAQQVKSSGTYGLDVATDAVGNSYVIGQSYYTDKMTFGSIVLPASTHFITKLSSNANTIAGRLFKDDNNNGVFDTGEAPFPNAIVQLMPGPLYTKSDANGAYWFYTEAGNYTITPTSPLYHVVSPANRSISFSGVGTQKIGNDFGVWPNPNVDDLRVVVNASAFPRPGFKMTYFIAYSNVGTTTLSGTIKFVKDGLFQYLSSTLNPTTMNGNDFTWDFTNLAPGQTRTIQVHLILPATVGLGTSVSSQAMIEPSLHDQVPGDNTVSYPLLVIGSYDPNDKQVSPQGKLPTSTAKTEDPFTYTVRFQNTGTASAITVKVLDTLSEKLNISSFEMLSSSHLYSYTLTGRGVLEWTFDNIHLPDSNSNEAASHGFIKYRIKPKNTLIEGDTVLNRAFIYFDYNAPIQTNTALIRLSDKADQTLSTRPITNRYLDSPAFSIATNAQASSGLPVSFRVVSGPATIQSNVLTLSGIGKVVVKVSQSGNETYNAAPDALLSFIVSKYKQDITFEPIANKHFGEPSFDLVATATSGLSVSFSVMSGPATIQGKTLTMTGAGEVKLKASQIGNTSYLAANEVEQRFEVMKAEQSISFPAIAEKTFGESSFELVATSNAGLGISFSVVSGPATLSGKKITITGVGEVKVKASQVGNANYLPAPEVEQHFLVKKAAQVITFPSIADKTFGDAAFNLAATSSAELDINFSIISGPATVSGKVLTITGTGEVKVKASQAGSTEYSPAFEVEQSFLVKKAAQSITFTALTDKTFGNRPFNLMATATSLLPVSFVVVSGPATISDNSLSITGAGQVKIMAVQAGNINFTAAPEVSQVLTIQKASQTITFNPLINQPFSDAPIKLSAISTSDLPVSFSVVSGPASVQGNFLTVNGVGKVIVKALQMGNSNYLMAGEVEQSFMVDKASQTLIFAPIKYWVMLTLSFQPLPVLA